MLLIHLRTKNWDLKPFHLENVSNKDIHTIKSLLVSSFFDCFAREDRIKYRREFTQITVFEQFKQILLDFYTLITQENKLKKYLKQQEKCEKLIKKIRDKQKMKEVAEEIAERTEEFSTKTIENVFSLYLKEESRVSNNKFLGIIKNVNSLNKCFKNANHKDKIRKTFYKYLTADLKTQKFSQNEIIKCVNCLNTFLDAIECLDKYFEKH